MSQKIRVGVLLLTLYVIAILSLFICLRWTDDLRQNVNGSLFLPRDAL